jgi:hypothetical protein
MSIMGVYQTEAEDVLVILTRIPEPCFAVKYKKEADDMWKEEIIKDEEGMKKVINDVKQIDAIEQEAGLPKNLTRIPEPCFAVKYKKEANNMWKEEIIKDEEGMKKVVNDVKKIDAIEQEAGLPKKMSPSKGNFFRNLKEKEKEKEKEEGFIHLQEWFTFARLKGDALPSSLLSDHTEKGEEQLRQLPRQYWSFLCDVLITRLD